MQWLPKSAQELYPSSRVAFKLFGTGASDCGECLDKCETLEMPRESEEWRASGSVNAMWSHAPERIRTKGLAHLNI